MTQTNALRLKIILSAFGGLAFVCLLTAFASAEDASAKTSEPKGSVEFDCPDAPDGEMAELDLSQGMFKDLFGIGDAAVAGVVEALHQSAATTGGESDTQEAADQLEAARQIVQLAGQVIKGVRMRDYDTGTADDKQVSKLVSYYDKKLHAQGWETIVRITSSDETIVVSALRENGAIKGVFCISADTEILLANVQCDISPENVKKLSAAATKISLQAGLFDVLKQEVHQLMPGTTEAKVSVAK